MKTAEVQRLTETAQRVLDEKQTGDAYELAKGVLRFAREREKAAREVGDLMAGLARVFSKAINVIVALRARAL